MDNQRLFLYGALGLLLLLIGHTWQSDYGGSGEQGAPAPTRAEDERRPEDTPTGPVAEAPAPEAETGADQAAADDAAGPGTVAGDAPAGADRALTSDGGIRVVTDLLDVRIDLRGGDLREARLRGYRAELGSDEPVVLMADAPGRLFVAQSGLQADGAPAPTHHATYTARARAYRLAKGQDTLTVPLTWEQDGIRVTKTYTFHRGRYVVDVAHDVENASGGAWLARSYQQLQRQRLPDAERSMLIPAFFGPAYYSPADKYEQLGYDEAADEPLRIEVNGGWTAMVEHYFLAAWIAGTQDPATFYTRGIDSGGEPRYIIGQYFPARQVPDGSSARFEHSIYLGPKENEHLETAAKGLELTIDYGYMTFLSAPLFWLLDHIQNYVRNWGVAIIVLTLLIKILFYKLSEKSYRSMAKMRQLQPKMQQLKERYGDDRDKMGRAIMDLYRKEKVNPLGGCLPILVQIPVFIALYWMLLGSVELRHAGFMLWINDLSARDPWFILPLLMGASMWAQQKLNPAPADPMQQRIFQALPFVFTVFFAFFPAGLVLYWLTNNVLSIAQQYYITRFVVGDKAGKPAKATSGD